MRPETLDIIFLQGWERDVKALAGDVHDCGFDDFPELEGKLTAIVGLCGELLSRAQRHERDRQDRAQEGPRDCVPPVEVGSWGKESV